MAEKLSDFVNALALQAEWTVTDPDAEGVYHFYLEDGIDLDIRTPDGRTCIISADLGNEPENGTVTGDNEIRMLGKASAASAQKRASVLCLAKGRIELYRRIDLQQTGTLKFIEQVRDFLNDQMWWKNVLSGSAPSASPFSGFSSGNEWFPSQMQF
jgi:hypothetical protein